MTATKKHTQHALSMKTESDFHNGLIKRWSHRETSHPEWWTPEIQLGLQKKRWCTVSVTHLPASLSSATRCLQRHTQVPGRYGSFMSSSCESKCNCNNSNNNHIQICNSRFFLVSCKRSLICTLKWPGCNCVQVTRNTSSAYHVQHVVLCATWYKGTAQLLRLAEC